MKKQEPRMEDNKDKDNKGDSKWDWQKKPLTNNQLEKTMNSNTYYWCPNHSKEGQWVHHTPEECSQTSHYNESPSSQHYGYRFISSWQ